MKPSEDYQRQIGYWKEAARQAEDEAAFLRGQYNEAEDKRGKAEAEVERLTALLDVSERKLGEWRDRGADVERLRAALEDQAKLARCVEVMEEIASETEHPCDGVILRAVAVRGLKGAGRAAPTAAHSGEGSRFRSPEPAPFSSLIVALKSIAASTCCSSCQEAALVARAALAAEKGE